MRLLGHITRRVVRRYQEARFQKPARKPCPQNKFAQARRDASLFQPTELVPYPVRVGLLNLFRES